MRIVNRPSRSASRACPIVFEAIGKTCWSKVATSSRKTGSSTFGPSVAST